MENKFAKKSTPQQLQALVLHMQDNPGMARGAPIFGASRSSTEDEWKKICNNLNSLGPPSRTIAEWKKTWADLKSRTKRKVASNNKSLRETGGGLYRFANLTELEEIIDRTLLLSSAAAPSGKTFAFANDESSKWVNDAMESILETPPRTSKAMAVVTPTRITKAKEKEAITDPQPTIKERNVRRTTYAHTFDDDSNAEEPTCSTKKKKTSSSEQVLLIRRQLRVAEQHGKSAKEQAEALTRLAAAAVSQAESAKKSSLAAESQAESAKKISESIECIEKKIDNFIFSQKKLN